MMKSRGNRRWVCIWLAAFLVAGWSSALYAGPLFEEGKTLYGKEHFKDASKVLKQSLEVEKESDESATLLLSDCYLQLRKHWRAVGVLKKGATRHPESWEIHYRLGNLQEESGDYFGALSAFYQASLLKPDDLPTTFRLGMAYDETAQIEKALEIYRKLHRAGSPLAPRLLRTIQGMD
ncbi:tetratricopeptide repeat protein [Desulfoluna spongiiphila]|uniref:Tetratricopeptide repeat-containing protein n=1 Tax=Desulfoluna spongiiphila TaxID=419481 RepID=A0A1G5J7Q8_9BACT|nr:tetratricopeptide repeat protein [Desulfoluna spongiiphila]SCY83839.1 Tetratricopeptide repeat-containing protein [Desulfoluna spongiiphila]VVS92964.1 tetratricopeptide repeat [Desulfoluna spongiiphila]